MTQPADPAHQKPSDDRRRGNTNGILRCKPVFLLLRETLWPGLKTFKLQVTASVSKTAGPPRPKLTYSLTCICSHGLIRRHVVLPLSALASHRDQQTGDAGHEPYDITELEIGGATNGFHMQF